MQIIRVTTNLGAIRMFNECLEEASSTSSYFASEAGAEAFKVRSLVEAEEANEAWRYSFETETVEVSA